MAKKKELTPEELERQASALLESADAAEDDFAEVEGGRPSAKHGKKSPGKQEETPAVMTDEEAKKAGIIRLDDKQVATLPAASWLIGNEKLRELLAKGKKKG
ncbi:MAG: RNA polymerase subunit sigma, partial [Oscillospiraceae bacterium]|nr:RNA polymerase subunit sigma [Oscillospiraceae bacterium]